MAARLELYHRLAELTRAQGGHLSVGDLDGYMNLLDARETVMREIDALIDGGFAEVDLLEARRMLQEVRGLDDDHRRILEALRARAASEIGELASARSGLTAYGQAARGGPGEALFVDRKR